jgi:rSAM/selenodomain-associated transferase 2
MISIIIPVLNEASGIGELLEYLQETSNKDNVHEILVVDGGSQDDTASVVTTFSKKDNRIRLLTAPRGRAKQLNVGAKQASGSILYFLHADSFPPKNFDTYINKEILAGNLAGCFKMRFNSNHWWLKLASWFTKFRWRACRGGDQSLFIARKLFEEIGGYDENFTIYEDNILINELYKKKQFVVIQQWLTTSARLYEKVGVFRLQYYFWTIYFKRWCGAGADEIYSYYLEKIAK